MATLKPKQKQILERMAINPEGPWTAELLDTSYAMLTAMKRIGWLEELGRHKGMFRPTPKGIRAVETANSGGTDAEADAILRGSRGLQRDENGQVLLAGGGK